MHVHGIRAFSDAFTGRCGVVSHRLMSPFEKREHGSEAMDGGGREEVRLEGTKILRVV
jgi:hypothetical protein